MRITEAIQKIKNYHNGCFLGNPIIDSTSRDQVLFGDLNQELTGVVTTCYASVEVIKTALELGANLIISHEALFWNHGDHTDWLQDNKTFQEKVKLLEQGNLVVWRDHDYIHSGIPLGDGLWSDGIYYGLMKTLGWESYLTSDVTNPVKFVLPHTTIRGLGRELMEKLNLNGIKVIGDPDSPAHRVWMAGHIMGVCDNQILQTIEEEDIDTILTMECIDFTVAEYIRDSTMAGRPKTILAVGHFNIEEPGMKYMINYLPDILGKEIPYTFVPCTDMYRYLIK